jgi:predicted nucleotide-binding protein
MSVSAGSRGGLSGLTSVIGKPQTRHENVFKLGLLVGSLGPGKVLILYGNERPQDIPDDLFGVRYIPFKEEGGWQIGLLKLLKANGFAIDANLLFD